MKKDEALKLALEALEYIHEGANNQGPHTGISWRCVSKKAEPAITAIREALAEQPAQQQEPVALPEKIYEFVPTPEPVKWHHPECEGQCIACLIEQVVQEAYGSQGLGYLQRHLTPPPASKPWVGLTDEEIAAIDGVEMKYIGTGEYVIEGEYEFARAIEAKLREKNA